MTLFFPKYFEDIVLLLNKFCLIRSKDKATTAEDKNDEIFYDNCVV